MVNIVCKKIHELPNIFLTWDIWNCHLNNRASLLTSSPTMESSPASCRTWVRRASAASYSRVSASPRPSSSGLSISWFTSKTLLTCKIIQTTTMTNSNNGDTLAANIYDVSKNKRHFTTGLHLPYIHYPNPAIVKLGIIKYSNNAEQCKRFDSQG